MNIVRMLFLLLIVSFGTVANAYDLNGSMSYDGRGSYSLSLENENGHQYSGEATDNGDGTFDVSLEDDKGQSYSGTMQNSGSGTYELDLQNDSSGGSASGTVTLDN